MTSSVLQKAKYAFNCDSCGKFMPVGKFYRKFPALSGKTRFYCEHCANERIKNYRCQECGKKWTIFKLQEEGWDDFEWIHDGKRIYKYGNKWLCHVCFNKKIDEDIRKNPNLFIRICEGNKPQENYRYYKLISKINCTYYFNCQLAVNYGYCKEICKVKCEICGKEIEVNACHVHHKIKLPRGSREYKFENPENVSIMCASCHKKEERNVVLSTSLSEVKETRKCICGCGNAISRSNKSGVCSTCLEKLHNDKEYLRKNREKRKRARTHRERFQQRNLYGISAIS